MARRAQWPDGPVVREVREARAKLWEEAGGTIEGLMDLVHSRAAELRGARMKKGDKGNKGKTVRAKSQ